MTDFQALINTSIKNFRISLGLSQEKFCNKCGLTVDNYRNLEYDRHMPKASTIDKICSCYNITPFELLLNSEPNNKISNNVANLLQDLDDKQIRIVKDFITLIRKYKI